MKFLFLLLALIPQGSWAQDHAHHAKHNMLLFGDTEVFASHLVYKEPHNYQVILKLTLDSATQQALRAARQTHPGDSIFLLLDDSDISQIGLKPQLTGLIYQTSNDQRHTILEKFELAPENYSMIYFDEVPLDLHAH